jgi:hypothetical protein
MFSRCAFLMPLLIWCTSVWAQPMDATLLHPVNIVAQRGADGKLSYTDPRGLLTQLGPKLGLSADEIQQARHTTGYIFCPGSTLNNGGDASAALVGRGDFVITVAHAFVDWKTGLRREPLSECFFQTQGVPSERVYLDFTEGSYKIFTKFPVKEFWSDVAVVRLKKPLAKWTPFPFDNGYDRLYEGEELIEVSADSEPWPSHLPPLPEKVFKDGGQTYKAALSIEPLVQRCSAIRIGASVSWNATIVYSDCSGKNGESGSAVLVRRQGHLVLKAVHTAGGHPSADFKPYATGHDLSDSERSFSLAVIIDYPIINDIKTLIGAH